MSTPCTATRLINDGRARITRFDFEPGQETGWHIHEFDYAVIALTDCHMRLEEPGGKVREVTVTAGDAYRRMAGVEHNVVNAGDAPMSFIEIELK